MESSILACYSLVHVEESKFGRINEKGCLEPNKKLYKIAYEWIEFNYPQFSSEIKRQKDSINELFSHSNIVITQTNIIEDEKKILALVFDSYPDSYIKVILWTISNNINSILKMYLEINKISNKVTFKDNLENKLNSLFVDLNKLKPVLLKEASRRIKTLSNILQKYYELMKTTSFNGLSEEEILLFIVNLTEISYVLQKIEGTNRVLELNKNYNPIFKLNSNKSFYYYNLSVAWSDAYKFKYNERVDLWSWVQEELENEIYCLRVSLNSFDYKVGDKTLLAQIYTNLGNAFNTVGRFIEALDNWDKALKIIPNFSMALANKSRCLFYHASHSLYDEGHKIIFVRCAYELCKQALAGKVTEEAKEGLLREIDQIEKIGSKFLKEELKFKDSFDDFKEGEKNTDSGV
ncbi:MAG: tetratricopeptide repeat protein [Ignavibacteria bacterium]|nr:tetratricopeptide repeat protein [Ignavibacteria bacterium]